MSPAVLALSYSTAPHASVNLDGYAAELFAWCEGDAAFVYGPDALDGPASAEVWLSSSYTPDYRTIACYVGDAVLTVEATP